MKRRNKLFISILAALTIATTTTITAFAQNTDVSSSIESVFPTPFDAETVKPFLDKAGNIKENYHEIINELISPVNRNNQEKVSVNSEDITLFYTFENPKEAIENIKKII